MMQTLRLDELSAVTGGGDLAKNMIAGAKIGAISGGTNGLLAGAAFGAFGLAGAGAVPAALVGGAVGVVGGAALGAGAVVANHLINKVP